MMMKGEMELGMKKKIIALLMTGIILTQITGCSVLEPFLDSFSKVGEAVKEAGG